MNSIEKLLDTLSDLGLSLYYRQKLESEFAKKDKIIDSLKSCQSCKYNQMKYLTNKCFRCAEKGEGKYIDWKWIGIKK